MNLFINAAARSNTGHVRKNNEDSAFAGNHLLALADGMGGHAGGEVASKLVISAMQRLETHYSSSPTMLDDLHDCMLEGNAYIADEVSETPQLEGMGTTLSALLFDGQKMGLIHVGDSRIYLLRDGEFSQITRDDTYVQSLVDEGRLEPEEALVHPQKARLMQALSGDEVEPTLSLREAKLGDRYLLCSDGLSDPVSADTIDEFLRKGSVQECADQLVSLALRSGGPDNVTVIVADIVDEKPTTQPVLVGSITGSEDTSEEQHSSAASRAAALDYDLSTGGDIKKSQVIAPTETGKRSSMLRFGLALLAALVALAGAAALTLFLVGKNHYVAASDRSPQAVTIFQGASLLSSEHQVVCIDQSPATFVPADDVPASCRVLTVNDLRPIPRSQVEAGMPSGDLDEAQTQVVRLVENGLLPTCENFENLATVQTSDAQRPQLTQQAQENSNLTSSAVTSEARVLTSTVVDGEGNAISQRVTTIPPAPVDAGVPAQPGINCRTTG